ncbi:hypothetical protein BpHYR1_041602 [Brachionus plicatilis]|uniref:Uncharacterized protein n=1 Tax=Brachionus plicatilis TaxID=10195 RepID=A0A3M7QB64_BRAPC|nr:hypothetical protein BpHYR1_041602 [Brachionus plicatilis]
MIDVNPENEPVELIKRGHGRPKKRKAEDVMPCEVEPKRNRGRPLKVKSTLKI